MDGVVDDDGDGSGVLPVITSCFFLSPHLRVAAMLNGLPNFALRAEKKRQSARSVLAMRRPSNDCASGPRIAVNGPAR